MHLIKQKHEKLQRKIYFKRTVKLFQKALTNRITITLVKTGRMQKANKGF